MKRYEKLTTEELMHAFNAPYEVTEAPNGLAGADCVGCVVWKWKTQTGKVYSCSPCSCTETIRKFLNEEIETTPRWKLAKDNADIKYMIETWARKQHTIPSNELVWSLNKYLCEEIELND